VSINTPDYDIADSVDVTTPAQIRAYTDPLRSTLLDLVLERAATVAELAEAVGRPKSTVAHHVNVLVDAGLLRVVRTRKVRAIEERFYGRTARSLNVVVRRRPGDTGIPVCVNELSAAAAESVPAHEADDLYSMVRHARIPPEKAREFWRRIEALVREFAQTPRSGDTVYGFVAGLYPTDYPTLPDSDGDGAP
jgi:DNA-binding transcriptional ArsR family regulator